MVNQELNNAYALPLLEKAAYNLARRAKRQVIDNDFGVPGGPQPAQVNLPLMVPMMPVAPPDVLEDEDDFDIVCPPCN